MTPTIPIICKNSWDSFQLVEAEATVARTRLHRSGLGARAILALAHCIEE
jgi:hypothetical protein